MPSGAKVLGSCYVCGRKCWGRRAQPIGFDEGGRSLDRKGVIVRDVNGIRHGECDPFPRGNRATLSDA